MKSDMNVQETKQCAPRESSILSDREMSCVKARLAKRKCSDEDWAYIKELLRDKCLFTVQPAEESLRFSIEGILYDKDALQLFTNQEDCEEYARRYAAVRIGRNYTIRVIPFEDVIRIADAHEKDAYIDIRQEYEDRFFVYAGKSKKLHLCINQ